MHYYCFSFMTYVTKQQIMNSNIKIITFCPFHRDKGCRDLSSAGSLGSCCPESRESEKIVSSKSKWCCLFWIRIYIMSIIVLARFNFSVIQKNLFKIPRIGSSLNFDEDAERLTWPWLTLLAGCKLPEHLKNL